MSRAAKPTRGKADAKRPRARESPKTEDSRGRDLEERLAEALEQQEATGQILEVISRSPADAQPVFDAIAANALKLCDAKGAVVVRYDGALLHLVAHHNVDPEAVVRLQGQFPRPPDRRQPMGRAVLDGTIVHVPDLQAAEEFSGSVARQFGARSNVSIPLLHQGRAIGAIGISRPILGPFSDRQIALLQTFASQAVVAIENVRLFTELRASNADLGEALDKQTATSEILRAISRSPTEEQAVFDAIVRSAARLCRAAIAAVFRTDGTMLHHPANYGGAPDALAAIRALFPRPLDMMTTPGAAILTRSIVEVPDVDDPSASDSVRHTARVVGFQSVVAIPMLRDGHAVGALVVGRREPGRFAGADVELLRTFADQAVIAIENVRLFRELEARNRDLSATGEILQVISRSPTDVQPVFDTITRNALALCGATSSLVTTFDGEWLHLAAVANVRPHEADLLRSRFPQRPDRDAPGGRAILTRAPVHIPDTRQDPYFIGLRDAGPTVDIHSILAVPMLRAGEPIGTINVHKLEPEPFSEGQIALLETFAAQAVIAVENVRLFRELEAQAAVLRRSVEQLRALGEVGRAVTSTLDLGTVLTTIVSRAVQLSELDGGVVFEYNDAAEEFVHRAQAGTGGILAAARRAERIRKGHGAIGRTATTREPVQVADITVPGAYVGEHRDNLIASGVRAVLAVPMIHEGRLIGCLGVTRDRPGEFRSETIELLRTFATQSALAIQNARLFLEIEDKSRQLEMASRHKSEFLANMSHELRTPLNAVIGFSEALADGMVGEINDKQAEYLRDILESGRHLLSLINDILDLSKIEAGRMELELTDFDLRSAIDSALTFVRERAARRGIELGHSIDPLVGTLRGDERKVKQVLLNLLSNALKFTPEGGRIDVRAAVSDGVAEVSVTDTGVGIASEEQEAIFEEFKQVGTADKKVEGTGLGLALSRKFIELHGGRIGVTSQLGAGSTFTFTIPLRGA
jgi:signal transduction histidine kinase